MPAIVTEDLCKSYVTVVKQPGIAGSIKSLFRPKRSSVEAVKDVNLSVEHGEIVGFLGPNGAGKTTTIKMLTGILYPTSGKAEVLGYEPFSRRPEMLRQISLVMGNKQQLWWDLPAWDSFVVLKELYDVSKEQFKERSEFLFEALQLTDKVNTQVRKLSLGERMKCELVAALLHSPRVLFLDEPTIGLDVVSQKRIRDFLRELNAKEGCAILLTSHYMQDIQELCSRVVVIDKGTVMFDGQLDELSQRHSDSKRLRLSFETPVAAAELSAYGELIERGENGDLVLAIARTSAPSVIGQILRQYPVRDLAIEDVSVDEVIRKLFEEGHRV